MIEWRFGKRFRQALLSESELEPQQFIHQNVDASVLDIDAGTTRSADNSLGRWRRADAGERNG